MKLLLDTHIWLWLNANPENLNKPVRKAIENPKNEIYLSPISIWEAHLLAERKKLRIKTGVSAWLELHLSQAPLLEAPFNFAVALEASRIRLPQSDLGDLFLAATAVVFDLTLVTADKQLLHCSWLKTLANE